MSIFDISILDIYQLSINHPLLLALFSDGIEALEAKGATPESVLEAMRQKKTAREIGQNLYRQARRHDQDNVDNLTLVCLVLDNRQRGGLSPGVRTSVRQCK